MTMTMTMTLLNIVAHGLNRYMHRQVASWRNKWWMNEWIKAIETQKSKTIKQQKYTFEMRVTIEDGVYNLLEVKIESMFDNGKGHMIQRTDIY